MSTSKKILFALIYCMIMGSKSIKRFGFQTAAASDAGSAASSDNVRLTLYWNDTILQCITYPIENEKYFGCEQSSIHTYPCYSNETEIYQLTISNHDTDTVSVDSIHIEIDDVQIIINTFCSDVSIWDTPRFRDNSSECLHSIGIGTDLETDISFPLTQSSDSINTTNVILGQNHPTSCSIDDEVLDKYILVPLRLNWSEAELYCDSHYGSHLASIPNMELLRGINAEFAVNENIAVGLFQNNKEDNWHWLDGTKCETADTCTTLWASGQPSPENEFCGGIYAIKKDLNNFYCYEEQYFLCNRKLRIPVSSGITDPPPSNWIVFITVGSILAGCLIVSGLFIYICSSRRTSDQRKIYVTITVNADENDHKQSETESDLDDGENKDEVSQNVSSSNVTIQLKGIDENQEINDVIQKSISALNTMEAGSNNLTVNEESSSAQDKSITSFAFSHADSTMDLKT